MFQVASTSEGIDESSKAASKLARNVATTFAPRPSGAVKNPAFKGTNTGNITHVAPLIYISNLNYEIVIPQDLGSTTCLVGRLGHQQP